MPFDAPFKLGPFAVDAEGRLSPHVPDAPPTLLFRWRQRVVRVRLDQTEDAAAGRLVLQAVLGRVPSTASTPDGVVRPRSFALLHWMPRAAPPDWRLHLLADHRVRLQTERAIALPITATGLLTEITRFLLVLTPYLELLDEAGLTAHPG